MKKYRIKLEDGTTCSVAFRSKAEAKDFYEIFYGMKIVEISDLGGRGDDVRE